MEFRQLLQRLHPQKSELNEDKWHRHENGKGWIQNTSYVSPEAYVGPDAIVEGTSQILDTSQVKDRSHIIDAIISHDSVFSDNAVVIGGEWAGEKRGGNFVGEAISIFPPSPPFQHVDSLKRGTGPKTR